jgi:hypothetical protein
MAPKGPCSTCGAADGVGPCGHRFHDLAAAGSAHKILQMIRLYRPGPAYRREEPRLTNQFYILV